MDRRAGAGLPLHSGHQRRRSCGFTPTLLTCAMHELAEAADELTMRHFRAGDLDRHQARTHARHRADRAVEGMIGACSRPNTLTTRWWARVRHSGSGAALIVDPIDGTKGYARVSLVWATLIALGTHAELVLGVVSAPGAGHTMVSRPRRCAATANRSAFRRWPASGTPTSSTTCACVRSGRSLPSSSLAGRCWRPASSATSGPTSCRRRFDRHRRRVGGLQLWDPRPSR